MRLRWFVIVVAFCVLVGYGAVHLFGSTGLPRSSECTASPANLSATVDLEQARWASLMAAIAEKRGLPARATTIAIAAAFQESKLHNIDYGDRDSVGLFQQRPSQGWGTTEQIMDPAYAIGKFYDYLVKVDGYDTMDVTVAAQRVQRSGYPGAYAQHEPEARALASALRGQYPAALTCYYTGSGGTESMTARLREGFGPDLAVSSGRVTVGSDELGWSVAHFIVANAAGTGVSSVSYDGKNWNLGKDWTREHGSSSPSARTVTYTVSR